MSTDKSSNNQQNSSSSTSNSQSKIDESTKSMFENMMSQSVLKTKLNATINGTKSQSCTNSNSSSDEKTVQMSDDNGINNNSSSSGGGTVRRLPKVTEFYGSKANHRSKGSDNDDEKLHHSNRNRSRSRSSDRGRTSPRSYHSHTKNNSRDHRRDYSSRHSFRS